MWIISALRHRLMLAIGLILLSATMSNHSHARVSSENRLIDVAQNTRVQTPAIPEQSRAITPPADLPALLPDGLNLDVHECIAAMNAISCDVNIQSNLKTNVILSLHGVYWNTSPDKFKKTAIISKTADKLSTEITVVPGADLYLSSLIVVNIANRTSNELSLGIHISVGGVEYYVNTDAVVVFAVKG